LKYRTTLIYLVAVMILGAVYVFETRMERKRQEAEEQDKKIFQLEGERLSRITITKEDQIITVQESGVTEPARWMITAPIRAFADDFEVDRLADKLAELDYVRVVEEKAADLAPFGLEKPALNVAFSTLRGTESLRIGSESPLEDAFYARKNDEDKVYLIASMDRDHLEKTLFELRDKRLFAIEYHSASGLGIERETGKWSFFKREGKWLLEGDEGFRVDQEKLESILMRILWLEASSFAGEKTADLKSYGLDRPRTRITVSDGDRTEAMRLGDPVPVEGAEAVYAMVSGRAQVVTVGKKLLQDLPRAKEDFQKREVKKEETGDKTLEEEKP
jgi:hypothetical protein